MISRIKMIANMNIMETRLPQDGAIKGRFGKKVLDLRVSSLPTNNGEKVVIRILDYSQSSKGLENLGFSPSNLEKIILKLKEDGYEFVTVGQLIDCTDYYIDENGEQHKNNY